MVPLTDTAEGLAEIVAHFGPLPRIAVDTEADSLHCYFEKLCLIQITIPAGDFLIDPLAGLDLTPLWQAWAGKELIIHGADYDLRLLRRTGCPLPTRVFDTMLASRLCGLPEVSYAALMQRYFDLTIAKSSQKADWARRPLTPLMLEYAVNDTKRLTALADILAEKLEELDRRPWFDQLCERAIRTSEQDKELDLDQIWRVPGSGHLRGKAAAIFRELWKWRDEEARRGDRPAFHICHTQLMVDAATAFSEGDTYTIRHLRGPREVKFQEAAARGLAVPEAEWPEFIRTPRLRPTKAQTDRIEELRARRDKMATELQIDPALIAAKAVLEGLVYRPEETLAKILPWQRELLQP